MDRSGLATSSAASASQGAGLVLAGGGVRGAYEVGVVAGIVAALGPGARRSPFRVFAGTSVGAINAAYLAAHCQRSDCGIDGLVELWRGLDLAHHLQFTPRRLLAGSRWSSLLLRTDPASGRSVLDHRPLEELVRNGIPFADLRRNIEDGHLASLAIAALEIRSGKTAIFIQHAPTIDVIPSRDPKRRLVPAELNHRHVLASAALPLLFPARRIERSYYCDGGLRFNTPIAPAIRSGADRLVVISPRFSEPAQPGIEIDHTPDYPSIPFLLGKLLNALLLDPLAYDLQVLARFNDLLGVLEETVPEETMKRVREILIDHRGAPYRRIETLVFQPSEDIGAIAADFVRNRLGDTDLGWLRRLILDHATRTRVHTDSDLASYLLFDGAFAEVLIELGRRDASERADEIRAFFS